MKLCGNALVLGARLAVILSAASVAYAGGDKKPAQPPDASSLSAAASSDKQSGGAAHASDYVGTETCKSCHENMYNS